MDEKKQAINVRQEQVHRLLFGDALSWQAIIYDLINTEQLDPWDVDISILSQKYLDRIREYEEHNFLISSKVLLAASMLLRMKCEILLERDLADFDKILFGEKKKRESVQQRIELDEEVPELVLRTPLPRFKKVSLSELMEALGKAINTETRRIKRITIVKQYEAEVAEALPKRRINIQDEIRQIYSKLKSIFSSRNEKLAFSEFAGISIEDRISTFVPLLYLDHQNKVWLEQASHFEEIWIMLKRLYEKQNYEELEEMRREAAESLLNLSELTSEEKERAKRLESEFRNPLE